MAKKTHLKVRMVPESNPDSKFIYYAKKPTKGEKAKEKLKLKKYNPNTRKHEFFIEKKLPPHSKLLFFFKISIFIVDKSTYHSFPDFNCNFWINIFIFRFF